MSNATFSPPDLDAFCGLDGPGLTATGQRVEIDRAVLDCRSWKPTGGAIVAARLGFLAAR